MNPLPNDEIAIWKVKIPEYQAEEKRLFSILSPEEQDRASRFITPILTLRYTISQAALRLVLARYANLQPEKITYSLGPYKKPYLKDNPAAIQFNLTHSNDLALIAISQGDEVGIDIEKLNIKSIESNVAPSILTPNELDEYMRMPRDRLLEAFFTAWTHKESLLKLLGTGLYKEMKELQVPLSPLAEPHPILVEGSIMHLQSFYVTTEYIASVASLKNSFNIRHFEFKNTSCS